MTDRNAALGLGALTILALLLCMREPQAALRACDHGLAPTFQPRSAFQQEGDQVVVRSVNGGRLNVAIGPEGEFQEYGDQATLMVDPDERAASRVLSIPLSLNWRHPLNGLPSAQVWRVSERDDQGCAAPVELHTVVCADHGDLPVLSLFMPHGALFDPDTGLMVVGNAIFHAPEELLRVEYHDPKWWKYPGNFHMRGKSWARKGIVQLIGSDGQEIFGSDVEVRINGQMTRGFPQHALRMSFPERVRKDLFGEPVKDGYAAVVLRAAGNDQIKAMFRDAFQHGLCQGLPFEVSCHRTCVVYINGAYWGVHHIRHRMDEEEIARRYAISTDRITILEDAALLYRGDRSEVAHFRDLADRTAAWDGTDPAWADSLNARMDVEGFLAYMASQMILGNVDWPAQNVRFWRFTGEPLAARPLDGRWYFIMGDSDLGYGAHSDASADMFKRVELVDVPITALFRGMMRHTALRQRFIDTARSIVRGPLSAHRSTEELEKIVALMIPEMIRHTARWRRPADVGTWMGHVEVIRTFAKEREAEVLRQLNMFEQNVN